MVNVPKRFSQLELKNDGVFTAAECRRLGKALTSAATRLLLARAALLFASLEVSIFLLFVSGVIWVFTDDGLEAWCDRCAFGIKRKALSDAYANAVTQQKRFDEALQEVL